MADLEGRRRLGLGRRLPQRSARRGLGDVRRERGHAAVEDALLRRTTWTKLLLMHFGKRALLLVPWHMGWLIAMVKFGMCGELPIAIISRPEGQLLQLRFVLLQLFLPLLPPGIVVIRDVLWKLPLFAVAKQNAWRVHAVAALLRRNREDIARRHIVFVGVLHSVRVLDSVHVRDVLDASVQGKLRQTGRLERGLGIDLLQLPIRHLEGIHVRIPACQRRGEGEVGVWCLTRLEAGGLDVSQRLLAIRRRRLARGSDS
mmetsp:Transcript_45980/g.109492  ORF Transcript_45980/g.109492 Transcript_45980/m.109492 type:complete len:258 (-) Transcript_45980:224-997(-)